MKYLSIIFIFIFALSAHAATFIVNQADDAGDFTCDATCTLRDAVDDAANVASDDTISFAAGITMITLTNQIQINNAGTLTIAGNGANVLTIDGGPATNRIFRANPGATVTIRGVTLSGGNGDGAAILSDRGTLILENVAVQNNAGIGDFGAGAVFYNGGTNHRIANSTFSDNTGFAAGAAFVVGGDLTVVNTTISGNSTIAGGGVGAVTVFGTATFRNTTITGNTATGTNGFDGGGGIYVNAGATVNLGNTIVAGNSSVRGGPDLYRQTASATITTAGGNLIGDNSGNPSAPNTDAFPTGNPNGNGDKVGTAGSPINPLLASLALNGGTTPTHALLLDSPAINKGNNANAPDTDQRGFPRIVGGTIDIGAYESNFLTPTPTPILTPTPTPSPTATPTPTPTPTPSPSPSPTPTPACTFTLGTTSQSFTYTGGSGLIDVITQNGCAYTATNNDSFVTLSKSSGTGNGTINFDVAANQSGASRQTTITVQGQLFTVNQSGAAKTRKRVRFF